MACPRAVLTTTVCLAALLSSATAMAAPQAVASIKPVHALVAAVMQGAGEPTLLIEGAASPHDYALRPSDAAALERADVVFWIGPEVETFLEGSIATLAPNALSVDLIHTGGLTLLPLREGGAFEAHEHDEDDLDHDAHDHEDAAHAAHDDADHDEEHGEANAHVWLSPSNAVVMTRAISEALSALNPDNADLYATNADAYIARIEALAEKLKAQLAPVTGRPFVVFHDAYHYFEDAMGIEAAGTITVNPEVAPGAKRLSEIRDRIAEAEAVCVFAEPQFEPRVIDIVIEGTDASTGVLDPLGADLEAGPDAYPALLENMAASLKSCLGA